MRFKLDENIPRDAEQWLRERGFDVETALSEGLSGARDRAIFEACVTEGRILVTLDLDFADIREYPPDAHRGIWILRPRTQDVPSIVDLVKRAVRLLESESVERRLWIVERERVRIRA